MRRLLAARQITRLRCTARMAVRVLRGSVGLAARLLRLTARVLVAVPNEPLFWLSFGLVPMAKELRGRPYTKFDWVCYTVCVLASQHIQTSGPFSDCSGRAQMSGQAC